MEDYIKIIYLLMIGFTILGVGLSFKYYLSGDSGVRYIMHVFYVFALITATYLLAKSSGTEETCNAWVKYSQISILKHLLPWNEVFRG